MKRLALIALLFPLPALAELSPRAVLNYIVLGDLVVPGYVFGADVIRETPDEIVLGDLSLTQVVKDKVLVMRPTDPAVQARITRREDGSVALVFDDMEVTIDAFDPETDEHIGTGGGVRNGMWFAFARDGLNWRISGGNALDDMSLKTLQTVDDVAQAERSIVRASNLDFSAEIGLYPLQLQGFSIVADEMLIDTVTSADGRPDT